MNKPITNCHTHIFTGDHVPPYLGKTLMPFPLYYFANINLLIAIVRSVRNGRLRNLYFSIKTPVDNFTFWYQRTTQHNKVSQFVAWLINTAITTICFILLSSFLLRFFQQGFIHSTLQKILLLPLCKDIATIPTGFKIVILIVGYIFVKWVRRIVKMMVFAAFEFVKNIAGSASIQLLKRYYNIALLSKDKKQSFVLGVLKKSYPAGSKFIVLPMDLDYAEAGMPKQNYMSQLNELIALKQKPENKDCLKPFVFADPRRLEADPGYYQTMIDCFEKENFSGIKIYPALGYYPFDKYLLELFLYACEKEIPITTHCIRGVIFYRGIKKKEWDYHPIFEETVNNEIVQLKLKDFKNIDFINNFTHPLNYICLLDPAFLKIVFFQLDPTAPLTQKLYTLYGFTKNATAAASTLVKDLSALKICFGHFGGEDEWAKYIDRDLSSYENKFVIDPNHSEQYTNPIPHPALPKKPGYSVVGPVWHRESWYSIIRNIMMNPAYPNVYADISFILYDSQIFSLLKSSLQVPRLQDKILYGTDFYVVRQKGTDKKFWIDIQSELTEQELELIAIKNPASFVK
jgi:hypothetical protein